MLFLPELAIRHRHPGRTRRSRHTVDGHYTKSQLRALWVSKVWEVLAQSQFLKVELLFDDMQNLVADEHPVPHVYYAVAFGEQRSQAQLAQLSVCPVVARRANS